MTGLFNLRGMIIPVVDLRILLDFPTRDETLEAEDKVRKVAIVENGDRCIGLLFDRSGEVLNEPNSARVDFRAGDGGIKDVVIDGVLKLEGGDRMVQLLDPYEMLRIERVPKAEVAKGGRLQEGDLGKRHNCISFQLGHTTCAIDLRYVQEVREMPEVNESLLAHGFVIGTTNLRGAIIPIVDFRSFIGNEEPVKIGQTSLAGRKLLIMKTEGGLIGLMVFSIDSILPYFDADVLPFAKLALPRGNIVKGCLTQENEKLVMLLDHQKLLSEPSLVEPARTCQEVHDMGDEKEEKETRQTETQQRKTFIIFTVSNVFAMDTCVVSEVITKPKDILDPPYTLEFVDGILNLRGELITLINLRKLYGYGEKESDDQKVLIFMHGNQKYGIVVDTVDEIVMTTSNKVRPLGTADAPESIKFAAEDAAGILYLGKDGEGGNSVVVMDVASVVARCVRKDD
jgi:purine-binding chemotaxis protein CheW